MLTLRRVRSTFVTKASNQTIAAASIRLGRRLQQRVILERVGQKPHPQVETRARVQRLAYFGVGLTHPEARRDFDEGKLGDAQPEKAADLSGHQLRDEGARALRGRMELQDVQLAVVRLDQRGD